MTEVKQLFIRLRSTATGDEFAPPELRSRIVDTVRERGTNLNEVVCEILAKRYDVAYAGRGRRANPSAIDEVIALRLPLALHRAITRAAARSGRNAQDEAIRTLCLHYDLPYEPSRKRNGPRVRAAA